MRYNPYKKKIAEQEAEIERLTEIVNSHFQEGLLLDFASRKIDMKSEKPILRLNGEKIMTGEDILNINNHIKDMKQRTRIGFAALGAVNAAWLAIVTWILLR